MDIISNKDVRLAAVGVADQRCSSCRYRVDYHLDGSSYNVNRVLTSLVHMAGVTVDNGSPVAEFGMQGFGGSVIPELIT